MPTKITILFFVLLSHCSFSQKMDNDALEQLLTKVTDSVNGYSGYWEIIHRDRQLLCITDETHNRMRIISPITQTDSLSKELLIDTLTANFHSALDVKYANSKGIIWAVFIHPLKELSENEVVSAIEQVVNAAVNFGTTFSSTEMIFGGSPTTPDQEEETPVKEVPPTRKL
ncbi:hypothetical protein [Aquimarina agarilytica]|uniref:hypothetical protein n=1 Tax=Aquimarina agarilytica TaxID=1087449 RepID=UPI000289EA0A|nr:hypothetical protein [Aquimarina agarilytica]